MITYGRVTMVMHWNMFQNGRTQQEGWLAALLLVDWLVVGCLAGSHQETHAMVGDITKMTGIWQQQPLIGGFLKIGNPKDGWLLLHDLGGPLLEKPPSNLQKPTVVFFLAGTGRTAAIKMTNRMDSITWRP